MKATKPQEPQTAYSTLTGIVRPSPQSQPNRRPARPKDSVRATSARVTAEQRHRIIELAADYRAQRRCVSPESDLRDWLDAEHEVTSH